MKQRIIFAFTLLCIAGCDTQPNTGKETSVAISVLPDFTDKRGLWPTPGPILSVFDFKSNSNEAAQLHLRPITDKRFNADYVVPIPSGTAPDANKDDDPQYRNRCIVSFYDSVQNAFATMYRKLDTTREFGNSEIFVAIADELHWLEASHTTKKVLLVYSNLIENSSLLSAYTVDTKESIPIIVKRLTATGLLPNQLLGYTIVFVNAPLTTAEDAKYGVMLTVYKQVLESRGAKVVVQSNNQNYLL